MKKFLKFLIGIILLPFAFFFVYDFTAVIWAIIKNFKVIICDEIGAGVVPLDKFERRWRDETGLLYQALVREADRVDRVWAGLALRLK